MRAKNMFVLSCFRMRVPVAMAVIGLMADRCISMNCGDESIRWFIFKEGYSAMEVCTIGNLQHFFFDPQGNICEEKEAMSRVEVIPDDRDEDWLYPELDSMFDPLYPEF